MPRIKGADVTSLKDILKKEGKETAFLSKLSESDREVYTSTIATSWNDVNIVARLYEVAGSILFSGSKEGLEKLGQRLGDKAYSGIYSVFLLIPKPSYVIKRAANVWSSYHDKGSAEVDNIMENSVDFIVRRYPELPKAIRYAITGHIFALLNKTGLKNLNMEHIESNPEQWVWHARWN